MTIDWTARTDDPKDTSVLEDIQRHLQSLTQPLAGGFSGLLHLFEGKSVLDIGAAAHDLPRFRSTKWKHRKIVQVASDCLGIDIVQSMVDALKKDGFDVALCDATSDRFLGRQFQVVFMGDLIEHVHSLDSLFAFARRHLELDGILLIATPNPFCLTNVFRVVRKRMFTASCEHVLWMTESMIYELSRRLGFELIRIYRPVSRKPWKRLFQESNLGLFSHHFYYALRLAG